MLRATAAHLLAPLLTLAILAGYFGPWFGHAAAGLVITGLDLGEFVKFVPEVRSGEIWVWRPGFYAPLVAAGVYAALFAFAPGRRPRWFAAALLIALTLVAAFNLVPPAWTPPRLLEPEFRWQTASLVALVAAALFSPFLGLLPRWMKGVVVLVPSMPALYFPLQGATSLLPVVNALYGREGNLSWGPYLMAVGLVGAALSAWLIPAHGDRLKPARS